MRNILGAIFRMRETGLVVGIIAISILMSFLSPAYLSTGNIRATVLSFAINGIVVIGMTIVLISGGIDLSVGSVMAITGAVAGALFQAGCNIWLAVCIALVAGAFIGFLNGLFITRIGLTPFITTLAMMGIARGLTFVITQGIPLSLYSMPREFKFLGGGNIELAGFKIPVVIIIFLVFVIVSDFLLRYSAFFRKVFFIGSNRKAAIYSGINVRRMTLLIYVISGLLASIGGLLSIARFSTATPYFGAGMEMQAIAAAVIGGASLSGGEGSIWGSILGIALLAIISSSLILLDVSVYWQELISGTILLLAVSIDYIAHKKKAD